MTRIILAVLLAVLIGACGSPPDPFEQEPIITTFGDMTKEWAVNPVAFTEKYDGALLEVSGVIVDLHPTSVWFGATTIRNGAKHWLMEVYPVSEMGVQVRYIGETWSTLCVFESDDGVCYTR